MHTFCSVLICTLCQLIMLQAVSSKAHNMIFSLSYVQPLHTKTTSVEFYITGLLGQQHPMSVSCLHSNLCFNFQSHISVSFLSVYPSKPKPKPKPKADISDSSSYLVFIPFIHSNKYLLPWTTSVELFKTGLKRHQHPMSVSLA